MTKYDQYRQQLRKLKEWDAYILESSGLPGPRGNLELLRAVADEGDEALFRRYLKFTPEKAPVNTPHVLLAACGVAGLGRLLCRGKSAYLDDLRHHASDPRWRIREAVTMALLHWGRHDPEALLAEMQIWSCGNLLEQRAVAATLCDPDFLKTESIALMTLNLLNRITDGITDLTERRSEEFRVLRKSLGYCWSVAAAALPSQGIPKMQGWMKSKDRDIQWIMRENLKKNRLKKLNVQWT